ncbi:MAG TPA: glycosyltransferase family 9 protein, partial [Chloroflexota bacterium]|nr:glycosyltransferase family 9 protein [Chloroflexota bacterium]
MLDSRWAGVRNLLLVRLDNIGDVVLLSAAIRTLKENLPDSRLTLMASPAGAKTIPLLPWIDDLLVWRAIWQDVGGKMPLDPDRELQLVTDLRGRRFDAAIIFTSFSQGPHGPAYACYLAGIPLRLGESKEFGGGLLTTELRNLPDDLYQGERSLRLLEGAG